MQNKYNTSKLDPSTKQEAGGGCPGAPCSASNFMDASFAIGAEYEALNHRLDAMMKKRGWKHTRKTPGSIWMWEKTMTDGRVILTDRGTAGMLEEAMCHFESLHNATATASATTNHQNTMQNKYNTSKPKTATKQEASGDCPVAPCSTLDLYATAALNGLLSNPTVIESMGALAYIDGDADGFHSKLVKASFYYAEYALRLRSKIILDNASRSASADEKTTPKESTL